MSKQDDSWRSRDWQCSMSTSSMSNNQTCQACQTDTSDMYHEIYKDILYSVKKQFF